LNSNITLSERVEQLAVELLVTGDFETSRGRWISSLISLAAHASDCGRDEVAQMARQMSKALEADSVAGDGQIAEFESGVARLRDAVLRVSTPSAPTSSLLAISQDPELLADFVLESKEHLESIEGQLLALEQDASNLEAVHSIFRSFHTIKGLAGFLELPLIQQVAHEVETVLDLARNGQIIITPRTIDIILESKDYLARWIKHLDGGPGLDAPADLLDNSRLIERVNALMTGGEGEPDTAPEEIAPEAPSTLTAEVPVVLEAAPLTQTKTAAKTASKSSANRSVKVDTEKLDYLVDMVGEMVIAQSLVRHDPALTALANPRLGRNLAQLARITDDVQRTAMSMRMVPIGPLFQKMARLVRDLSRKFGKQVLFESEGEDVDLDRNIVEELADPLMHMVRNSIDHGIETPDQRAAAGKSRSATVRLRAFHRSGQIVIQVMDDGRGIHREKVLAKARKNGLVPPNGNITDQEILNLIFHPGFSTAEQISDVSGRGVGMDVVKKQIQKLRGSVDIESPPGQGTTFSLRLPLTLAIIDGLVVTVGAERFIIPLASVKEMLRPSAGTVSTVENRAEVVIIRDRMLPVLRLYSRFGIEPRSKDPYDSVFIVADVDGLSFCLMVDELIGKQEVVIKSLGPVFQHVSGIAGGAILGDGHIGLILDIKGIYGSGADV
jgi:two-component system chemotaxis sensor kinase CheA